MSEHLRDPFQNAVQLRDGDAVVGDWHAGLLRLDDAAHQRFAREHAAVLRGGMSRIVIVLYDMTQTT